MTKEIQPIRQEWIQEFDKIVADCAAATSAVMKSLQHDMTVLNGIQRLKVFFHQPAVQELVLSAACNDAGFLCDKTNYTYDELISALIPRILEGYRMTGNEINIISGKGMAVKRGKYRRIIELTKGFQETLGAPTIKNDGFALIRCAARWTANGVKQTIGVEENDPCTIKIKYNAQKYDTIDKANGLAQSKLYSRVLTRITGQFVAEEPTETMDITAKVNAETPKAPTPPPETSEPHKREYATEGKMEHTGDKPEEKFSKDLAIMEEMLESDEYKEALQTAQKEKLIDDGMIQKAKAGNADKARQVIITLDKLVN